MWLQCPTHLENEALLQRHIIWDTKSWSITTSRGRSKITCGGIAYKHLRIVQVLNQAGIRQESQKAVSRPQRQISMGDAALNNKCHQPKKREKTKQKEINNQTKKETYLIFTIHRAHPAVCAVFMCHRPTASEQHQVYSRMGHLEYTRKTGRRGGHTQKKPTI